jgi:glutamate carboxypeptidase
LAHSKQKEMISCIAALVECESPSDDQAAIAKFVKLFSGMASDIARVRLYPGKHLRCEFRLPGSKKDGQILALGHSDTVWPLGTLRTMPFRQARGRLWGPGVLDMKAGLVFFVFAMRILRELDVPVRRRVILQVNSDEEVGSASSRSLTEDAAKQSVAVVVLEPGTGLEGKLKTARKGVGRFTIKAIGRAAHAGIDPTKGINAIEEIARQVLSLQAMSNAGVGTSVTVGVIQGGTRSNVVPAEAAVEVDVRVATNDEASRMTTAIHALRPHISGARLEIRGAINRPPMVRTTDTVRLFELSRSIGAELEIDIGEGSTGGASDGNFTSALGIPTLDGLGAVGDGAHSVDEYVDIASLPLRAALLAGLIQRIH